MNQVVDFFRKLGDTSDWPPRWHCGRWSDFHGWLYIISDLLVWSAYFCIPLLIVLFIAKKRRDGVRFHRIYFLFAAFILLCGVTHFLDAMMFWVPAYRIGALARLATGLVSWTTVVVIFRTLPLAFSLKSPELLEREVQLRTEAEERLLQRHQRMITAEIAAGLCHWTWDLGTGRFEWSESTYQIFNLPDDYEMDTKRFFQSVHADDREWVGALMTQAAATGQFENYQCRTASQDGRMRHVRITGTTLVNEAGTVVSMSGTAQDVTVHQKQLRRIEEQNRRLRTIAAMQSHRVRGPLATILGITQVLEHTGGPNDELIAGLQEKARELDAVVQRLVRATRVREDAG